MQERKDTGCSRRRLRETSAIILCVMILSGLSVRLPMVSAQNVPQIIVTGRTSNIQPSNTLVLDMNQTFTMTVNLTDFLDLYAYQVVFKYNRTVVNMTGLTFPSDSVLASQNPFYVMPGEGTQDVEDTVDHLSCTVVGATLLGMNGVNVSNGVLFEASFMAVGIGETTIQIATLTQSAHFPPNGVPWYTFCMNSTSAYLGGLGAITDFVTKGLTILSGVLNAAPICSFTVRGTNVDNNTNLILEGTPHGAVSYTRVLKDLPVYFNASDSYAPSGHITAYIWNFGDGNTTIVNATGSPTDALVTHVYTEPSMVTAQLIVVAETGPNSTLISTPYTSAIRVDMALPIYNWWPFIYTVLGLMVAAIVISAATSAMRSLRRRRLKQQKARQQAL